MEQRTEDWFAYRAGRVTASRIADLTARTKTGWGASRENYMAQLLTERLTGQAAETYTNAAMQWGTDTEPQARAMYELETGVTVEEIGFIDHPTIEMAGASPDGLIGNDGMTEIKCPNTATHLKTLESGAIDGKHIKQMQWQMACSGRAWNDFVSFDPRLPGKLQLFVTRVERDDKAIAEIEEQVAEFLAELAERETKLRERMN